MKKMKKLMVTSMRLFIAVPVSEEVSIELERWVTTNREEVLFRKWVHPSDYHITLQFLGETHVDKIEALHACLGAIQASPFPLSLNKSGYFGRPNSPSVLWWDLLDDSGGLHDLHRKVVQATNHNGYEMEKREYVPHITIARNYIGNNRFPAEKIKSIPSEKNWIVDRFTLMRTCSHISPMYKVLGSYPLK